MLIKIMIFVMEYFYCYLCEMLVGVYEYVDKGMNCEDIVMNFFVFNLRFVIFEFFC